MTGIYFMQAMGICVLLVKRFELALLLLPLIVVTIAFHKLNLGLFKRPWTLMSLKEAAILDGRDQVREIACPGGARICCCLSACNLNLCTKALESESSEGGCR